MSCGIIKMLENKMLFMFILFSKIHKKEKEMHFDYVKGFY